MSKPKRNWTRPELLAAFGLYCRLPFGKFHHRNSEVIHLAELLDRTTSAVAWKLSNFARLDPDLQARNIRGASHGSKAEIEIWEEYSVDPESLAFQSTNALATFNRQSIEDFTTIDTMDFPESGIERDRIVKTRVNQDTFRKRILAAYRFRCCITGLSNPTLLNASHIIPWKDRESTRLNPRNGVCLNVLHDRAFDRGLLTITPDFVVKFSSRFLSEDSNSELSKIAASYNGATIKTYDGVKPNPEFLEYHNKRIFKS